MSQWIAPSRDRVTPDVVRWWWVRHAPTRVPGFVGWSDPPADLSDPAQLAALRSALPEDALLLTSDLQRAIATADAIARTTWRRRPPDPALREQNFGDWDGASYDALPEREAAAFWENPAEVAPPGGESFSDVCARVGRAVDRFRQGSETDVVAVAHAGAIRAALALALDLRPWQALRFEAAPLSLTRLDWVTSAQAWRVCAVNLTL